MIEMAMAMAKTGATPRAEPRSRRLRLANRGRDLSSRGLNNSWATSATAGATIPINPLTATAPVIPTAAAAIWPRDRWRLTVVRCKNAAQKTSSTIVVKNVSMGSSSTLVTCTIGNNAAPNAIGGSRPDSATDSLRTPNAAAYDGENRRQKSDSSKTVNVEKKRLGRRDAITDTVGEFPSIRRLQPTIIQTNVGGFSRNGRPSH